MRTIDSHIEYTLAGRTPVNLRKFQSDVVRAARNGKRISKISITLGLVHSRIDRARDSLRRRIEASSNEARIGAPDDSLCVGVRSGCTSAQQNGRKTAGVGYDGESVNKDRTLSVRIGYAHIAWSDEGVDGDRNVRDEER